MLLCLVTKIVNIAIGDKITYQWVCTDLATLHRVICGKASLYVI